MSVCWSHDPISSDFELLEAARSKALLLIKQKYINNLGALDMLNRNNYLQNRSSQKVSRDEGEEHGNKHDDGIIRPRHSRE